ncbi:MAG: response regulator [Deltaproteobacteria bacterium]|nr:response regulator [Deltaproteobacteria bacterium]
MPKAGKISVRTSSRYVEKTQRGYEEIKEGEYVVLTVEDEGIGIPPQDINRIFEPFYTKKVMGRSGTGLGLAVVWGTAKDHKGYIDVFSREGKGSRFDLYLPVTRQEVNRKEPPVAPEEMMGPEKVLITDDVQEQREVASLMLAKLGYDVKAVSSGEEAVAYLHDHPVDLVLLDMIMDPGMDGLETYKRILEINPQQKAILVSGYSETNRVKEALRLGAGAYVKKPFVMEKIGRVVRKELDRPQPAISGRNTEMEPLAKAG